MSISLYFSYYKYKWRVKDLHNNPVKDNNHKLIDIIIVKDKDTIEINYHLSNNLLIYNRVQITYLK